MTSPDTTLVAVNFHLYKPCNYRCRFCFATYRDIDGHLPLADAMALLRTLPRTRPQTIQMPQAGR